MMKFGYTGTGPGCFYSFLTRAGFNLTYEQVTTMEDGTVLRPQVPPGLLRMPNIDDSPHVRSDAHKRISLPDISKVFKVRLLPSELERRYLNFYLHCTKCWTRSPRISLLTSPDGYNACSGQPDFMCSCGYLLKTESPDTHVTDDREIEFMLVVSLSAHRQDSPIYSTCLDGVTITVDSFESQNPSQQ